MKPLLFASKQQRFPLGCNAVQRCEFGCSCLISRLQHCFNHV